MTAPLKGLRVFDLTRILAGPTCTQLLGDLGAEVIKIERPGEGDDTRKWGPPFVQSPRVARTPRKAPTSSRANRNKRSVTIDVSKPEGQKPLRRELIGFCDILVENFKVWRPRQVRPLGYEDLKPHYPAPDLLLDHRLRPDRALRAARRLRLPGARHGRHHVA